MRYALVISKPLGAGGGGVWTAAKHILCLVTVFALECIEGWEEVCCFSTGLETNKNGFCICITNFKDMKYPGLRIDSLCLFAANKVYLLNNGIF